MKDSDLIASLARIAMMIKQGEDSGDVLTAISGLIVDVVLSDPEVAEAVHDAIETRGYQESQRCVPFGVCSVQEASYMLGRGETTIKRMCREGTLQATKDQSGHWIIDLDQDGRPARKGYTTEFGV